ncbi:hypothetical protein DCO58_07430 [Helicobacter saguini]|uniref:Uncharacterized protein n=1 Tax=Helicobacter saguini TaxID=1548018 RepID=A0A347W4I2_9HELI|nr:hypothetical protein [Helicobacter saguini]MWV61835.1 hypothetical protein [Helicobacter saguini]MWV67490.1 hypothetical protein [Helicobacter saguini]MWV69841.1 hypothetical protein [Helicobacter saguini]MWV72941.1 hypothetical protein [Helicobacter saguini]TLD95675.1 hypothetical protein LS64_002150 [Helicobacter saguini]
MDSKKDSKEIDYKDTLILPKTAFPMKANLPQNEPLRYAKWREFAYKIMSVYTIKILITQIIRKI